MPDIQCPYTSWWKIPRSDWPLPPKTFPRRLLKKHQGCGCAWNGFDASSTACVAPLAARRTHGDEAVPVIINSLIQHCPWSLTTFWEAGKMSRVHKIIKSSSKISHLSSHLSINDTFRLTLSHTVPFPVLFFCTERCQKSLKLSKNAGNDILSCCQRAKLGFKYIFNIHWQKLRTGLEAEIWVKSEGLFLPICHTLQGSEQLSEKFTWDKQKGKRLKRHRMAEYFRSGAGHVESVNAL